MNYIIDCSFSSALFLPDEKSDLVRDFFIKIKNDDNIFIPLLWWYETSNVLNTSIKRKRLSHADVAGIIELFEQLKLETDYESGADFSKRVFEISQLYSVSSYDAVYLELALRKKGRLMTLDRELLDAAVKIGLEVN